jgi:hypothetical protein
MNMHPYEQAWLALASGASHDAAVGSFKRLQLARRADPRARDKILNDLRDRRAPEETKQSRSGK